MHKRGCPQVIPAICATRATDVSGGVSGSTAFGRNVGWWQQTPPRFVLLLGQQVFLSPNHKGCTYVGCGNEHPPWSLPMTTAEKDKIKGMSPLCPMCLSAKSCSKRSATRRLCTSPFHWGEQGSTSRRTLGRQKQGGVQSMLTCAFRTHV